MFKFIVIILILIFIFWRICAFLIVKHVKNYSLMYQQMLNFLNIYGLPEQSLKGYSQVMNLKIVADKRQYRALKEASDYVFSDVVPNYDAVLREPFKDWSLRRWRYDQFAGRWQRYVASHDVEISTPLLLFGFLPVGFAKLEKVELNLLNSWTKYEPKPFNLAIHVDYFSAGGRVHEQFSRDLSIRLLYRHYPLAVADSELKKLHPLASEITTTGKTRSLTSETNISLDELYKDMPKDDSMAVPVDIRNAGVKNVKTPVKTKDLEVIVEAVSEEPTKQKPDFQKRVADFAVSATSDAQLASKKEVKPEPRHYILGDGSSYYHKSFQSKLDKMKLPYDVMTMDIKLVSPELRYRLRRFPKNFQRQFYNLPFYSLDLYDKLYVTKMVKNIKLLNRPSIYILYNDYTGKFYVGLASKGAHARIQKHLSAYHRGKFENSSQTDGSFQFGRDYLQHPADCYFSVINLEDDCYNCQYEKLEPLERFYIRLFAANNAMHGYNRTVGIGDYIPPKFN